MLVFSIQKNISWNGSGYILKNGKLELSSFCYLSQLLKVGTGKYKIKVLGNSLSGNGVFSFKIFLSNNEILSKAISLNRANTEISFDLDLTSPGPYEIRISRGNDAIGRVSINLINFIKVIEKPSYVTNKIEKNSNNIIKTFVMIDYDNLDSNQLSQLFLSLNNYKNCFFLLKSSESFIDKSRDADMRIFFNWEDLFDYISISEIREITFFETNINKSIFSEYNCAATVCNKIINGTKQTNVISGVMF